jgi:hypothetical protein
MIATIKSDMVNRVGGHAYEPCPPTSSCQKTLFIELEEPPAEWSWVSNKNVAQTIVISCYMTSEHKNEYTHIHVQNYTGYSIGRTLLPITKRTTLLGVP